MIALRNSVFIVLAMIAGTALLVSTTGCLDELTGPKTEVNANCRNVDSQQLMFKINEAADVDDGYGNVNTQIVQHDVVPKTQLDAVGRFRDNISFRLKISHRYWIYLWFINGDQIGSVWEFRPDALQNAGNGEYTVITVSSRGVYVQEKPGAPLKPLPMVPSSVVRKAGGAS